ncbi:MAG: 50S ribosomal protein L11 [Nitrososphaerota archaeon]|nr:50S ribosomal protein L11 [Candidatus Calditenuaceae archaeon]MDW8072924.1 50S ribosomal protein L11 [Nitrososphaerota archaeon]
MAERTFKFLVEGGKATAGPPIGPLMTPLGINVLQLIEEINQKTAEFRGMHVNVIVSVDTESKAFRVEVGVPSTVALISREVGLEKGSGSAGKEAVGDLSLEGLLKIAKLKTERLRAKSLKAAVLSVAGTCVSMGVTIAGKNPKEFIKEVRGGKYDDLFAEATSSSQA